MEENGMKLTVVPVDANNRSVFDRLIQSYECEFSAITEKKPLPDGTFELDTHLGDRYLGYLGYLGEVPCGFNVIKIHGQDRFEVCEFFIIPVFRRHHLGYELMATVCNLHRGKWEVKQISGAYDATAFWRRAIGRYSEGDYVEDSFNDHYWGAVTRQVFNSSSL